MIYKVLKSELFIAETKLLGKYKLWENKAMSPTYICHIKNFGTKDDMDYMSYNTFWAGFNTENKELETKCSSYGGMCGFEFTKDTLKEEGLSKIDRDCIEYTFKFINTLKEKGIICENEL